MLVIVISAYNLSTGCAYDRKIQWALVIYLSSLVVFFVNFYSKSYTARIADRRLSVTVGNRELTVGSGREESGKSEVRLRSNFSLSG